MFTAPPPAISEALTPFAGRRCVVGVSGGRDSMALLCGLLATGCRPVVGHVQHGLRSDDDKDATLVSEFASQVGLRFACREVTLSENGESVEEQARRLRYDALADIAASEFAASDDPSSNSDCPALLVAHTADDMVEHLLFSLIRGTGLRGISGHHYRSRLLPDGRRLPVERPFTNVSRATLTGWLRENEVHWLEDPTNTEFRFTRNRIRHELIPLLETFNPNVKNSLGRFREIAMQAQAFVEHEAGVLLESAIAHCDENSAELSRGDLSQESVPPQLRAEVFRQLWMQTQWPLQKMSKSHWDRLASLIADDAPRRTRFDLPAIHVTVTPHTIMFRRR